MPVISVVTACYNAAATLGDTLASVYAQQGVELEYIVVDGGSQDESSALINAEARRVGSRLTRWISEPDRGIYHALNKGLALATGEIVGFLHADDVFAHPHVLRRVTESFADSEVVACYGDLEYVSRDAPAKVLRHWRAGPFAMTKLRRGWMPPHPTLYVRRSWYVRNGGFDLRYRIAADYDLMLRLLKDPGGRVAYIPEVLVRMRFGGASNRSLANIARKSIEDYRALRANRVGGFRALVWKNVGKLPQFVARRKPVLSKPSEGG